MAPTVNFSRRLRSGWDWTFENCHPQARGLGLASGQRWPKETCAVSVTHSLDGPFDHHSDCAAPPGGVRAPERGGAGRKGESRRARRPG